MEQFVEVHTKEGKRLINLRWVEVILKEPDGGATICFAFNEPGSINQDYIETDESYSEILNKIWR